MVRRMVRQRRRKIKESGGIVARTKTVIPTNMIATKNYVNKIVRSEIETKYFDQSSNFSPDYSGTSIFPLCDFGQGTTDSLRIGDQIKIRRLYIGYHYYMSTVSDASNLVRIIVFQYNPNTTTGGAPTASLVLQQTSNIVSPLVWRTNDRKQDINVLYDKTDVLDAVSRFATVKRVFINLKYAKKTVQYNGNTTDGSHKLYVLFVSDSSAAPNPNVLFQTRLWYDDA